MTKQIQYFGKKCIFKCDEKCSKAWGRNSRPTNKQGEYLSDDELGEAPDDPETYEGFQGKPLTVPSEPNKWCVRECERGSISEAITDKLKETLHSANYQSPLNTPAPNDFISVKKFFQS